jgi:UDP-N-acetylmuramate--alanine ligase
MSALAQVLLEEGHCVSGSDRHLDRGADLEVLQKLRGAGVGLFPQDGSGLTPETTALVISTAIEKDNPDVRAAERLGVPLLHRAECLAQLVEGKTSVAVTGTSGKSTVTGMIGWMLEQVGADPVVVNGAPVLNWVTRQAIGNVRVRSGPVRKRAGEWWVFEADESDRSLLKFRPDWAVITNVSKDHFDEKTAAELFEQFRGQAKAGVIDELDLRDVLDRLQPELSACGSVFAFRGRKVRLPVPGRHNAENAAFALALCERLGFKVDYLAEALGSFQGIQRRLEVVGQAGGVTVVDDYAHNPAKIRAAWESLAPYHRRLIAVWRPHGYGPLRSMLDELTETFSAIWRVQDRLLILPVYDAGGTADRRVNSDQLVAKLTARGISAAIVSDESGLAEALAAQAQPGDTILIMGARDPGLSVLGRAVAERLGGP